MNYYEKNNSSFFKRYKISINELVDNSLDDIRVEIIDKNEKKIPNVYINEKSFRLDSEYDTDVVLNEWYENVKGSLACGSKIFAFGFGKGLYVKKILEMVGNDKNIIVYEPSVEIFKTISKVFDISELIEDKRVVFIFDEFLKQLSLKQYLENLLEYVDLTTAYICYHANYERMFQDKCVVFFDSINAALLAIQANHQFVAQWGKMVNESIFRNIKFFSNSSSLESLRDSISNCIPTIIVSAGPSLEKNIKCLREAKGKAVIIATDAAMRALAKNGVEADISIAVDPIKDDKYYKDDISKKIPLVCGIGTGWKLLNEHKGTKFFFYEHDTYFNDFLKAENITLPFLETAGSVANSAFYLAWLLGSRTIILVGQDLAYTGGKTHAVGTVRGDDLNLVNKIIDYDIDGNEVVSSIEFSMYKRWFEEQIKSKQDLKVIDATEGGVFIRGTDVMTLHEAIKRECKTEIDVNAILSSAPKILNPKAKKELIEHYNGVPLKLQMEKSKIAELIREYEELLLMVEKDDYLTESFADLSHKANCLLTEIENVPEMEFVERLSRSKHDEILRVINKIDENKKEDLQKTLDYSKKYAESILESINTFIKDLEGFSGE